MAEDLDLSALLFACLDIDNWEALEDAAMGKLEFGLVQVQSVNVGGTKSLWCHSNLILTLKH